MKFSIIVVSLNAGDNLKKTIQSIEKQSCEDYEIIIKDGGSTDGSLDFLSDENTEIKKEVLQKILLFTEKDKSIYDAMNQAVTKAGGEYYLFLNCGDYLYDSKVLEQVKNVLDSKPDTKVLYGNLFNRNLGTEIYAYSKITPFTCYRNVPCHQTCFYQNELFKERAYDLTFPVRADYEHFLYCYFTKRAQMEYLPAKLCSYEGAGFSETKEHLKMAKKEHQIITKKYMSFGQRFCFRGILVLTLQPLRTFMANHKALSGFYNGLKNIIYRKD